MRNFFWSLLIGVQSLMSLGSLKGDEGALCALSSLCFHLDVIQNQDGPVEFNADYLEILWQQACRLDENGELAAAHAIYTKAIKNLPGHSSKKSLKKAWALLESELQKRSAINYAKVDYSRFLLESHHPARARLEEIFSDYNPLKSMAAMKRAGFRLISKRPSSMCVLAHDKLPGYLVKLYPSNEKNNDMRDMTWAVKRCIGAENIRNLIAEQGLRYFSVPKKWLFFVPQKAALEAHGLKNYVVLLVEDMRLEPLEHSRFMWKHVSRDVIKELYVILSRGYSSCLLPKNVPYTKDGRFSCIDTENPQRKLPFQHVKKHLAPQMHAYWDKLVRTGGDTAGFQVTQP